jgi:DNA polymerase-3 subunit gamma/tau
MDKFIVSARKYRPQNFSTVIGQSHITTTLKNAINNNQLAHAFLFCGPRGVGKTTCARILAKTINCEKRSKEGEACNKCNSCESFDKGSSFNIHELDAASNNGVEEIRSLVDQIRFAPQAGAYKVYIVDEVHMLSQGAFNAFLKTLEEPPPYAIFILATTEKHKILPTILSRCQIFDFKRITANDTVQHLQEICKKEKIKAEQSALHVIAQKSEGCLRDALSILDKIVSFTEGSVTYSNTLEHLNILDEDYYFKWLDQMQQQQTADAMLLFDEINQKGFEPDTLLEGFAEFTRNLLVCKDEKAVNLLEVAEDFKKRYHDAAKTVHTGWLISTLNLLSETLIQYKQAKNKRLHTELVIIKLCYLNQAIQLTIDDQSLVKKKTIDSVKAVQFKAIGFREIAEKKPTNTDNHYRKTEPIPEAKLMVEETVKEKVQEIAPKAKAPVASPATEPKTSTVKPSLGSLSKIRQQIAGQHSSQQQILTLNEENLQQAWQAYIQKLIAEKNHSAVTNFNFAKLQLTGDSSFDIITENNIQHKFIEAERAKLIDHIQGYFKNKQLKYQITIVEKPLDPTIIKTSISSKELYQKLVAQYPHIRELKEKLNLDI